MIKPGHNNYIEDFIANRAHQSFFVVVVDEILFKYKILVWWGCGATDSDTAGESIN